MLIIGDYSDAEIHSQHTISDEKLAEYRKEIAQIMDKAFLDPEVQRVINTIDSISLH